MKHLVIISIVLLSGCAAIDETANHAFRDVACTIESCSDDEVCVAQKCHWKCKTAEECDPGEGCLPTAEGTLMCFDQVSYDKLVPTK